MNDLTRTERRRLVVALVVITLLVVNFGLAARSVWREQHAGPDLTCGSTTPGGPRNVCADLSLTYPCQQEDGSGAGQQFPCYWDATYQGNGRGETYFILGGPDGLYLY